MNPTLLAFSLGPAEIVGLLVVLIFLFGPKRIPEIGKSIGEALTSFKKATREVEKETSEALKDETE
jgi:sec-independent protein translocase protein TatA